MRKFVVPNLIKEDKQLPISSVVLASQRVDLRDSLYLCFFAGMPEWRHGDAAARDVRDLLARRCAFETPPLPVMEGLDAKTYAVPLRFSLALSRLPPGKYDCQVSIVDPGSQKAAFWQAPVMLVP